MYKDLGKHAVQRQSVLGENAERHYPKKRKGGSVFSSHGSSLMFNPTCITITEPGLLHSAIKNSLHTGSHVQFPYREVVPRHSGERHTSCPFSTARPRAAGCQHFEIRKRSKRLGRGSCLCQRSFVSILVSYPPKARFTELAKRFLSVCPELGLATFLQPARRLPCAFFEWVPCGLLAPSEG